MVSIEDRVAHFRRAFPKSHMCIINGRLSGMWLVGNTYRGAYSDKYYGAYPHSYLDRVLSLFPDMEAFHLFSGMVDAPLSMDLATRSKAKIIGDAHQMPIKSDSLEFLIADPPYTKEDAARYGTPPIGKIRILRECWRVLQMGGFLVWLDLTYPQHHYKDWFNFSLYGLIGVVISTQHRIRLCTVLQKDRIKVKPKHLQLKLPNGA